MTEFTGVGGGDASTRGCKHPLLKSFDLVKISENLETLPEKMSKIGAQHALI